MFKMRRHTVDDLINSARLEITIADVQKREPIQFTFRNTACELVFMGSEAVCNDSNADSLTVFSRDQQSIIVKILRQQVSLANSSVPQMTKLSHSLAVETITRSCAVES